MILEKGKTILEKKNLFFDSVFFLAYFQNLNTKSHKPMTKKEKPKFGFLFRLISFCLNDCSFYLLLLGFGENGLAGRCVLGSTYPSGLGVKTL